MNTLEDVLNAYVTKNGSAKVFVNGNLEVNVNGVEKTTDSKNFDIYVVKDTNIDSEIAKLAKVVIYLSNSKINFRPRYNPEAVMQNLTLNQRILNENIVIYTKGAILEPQIQIPGKPTLPPEFYVPVGTTINPIDLIKPTSGVKAFPHIPGGFPSSPDDRPPDYDPLTDYDPPDIRPSDSEIEEPQDIH